MDGLTQGSLKKTKAKMTTEQSMTQEIMQAVNETDKGAIISIREANKLVKNATALYAAPISGGPALKLSIFECKAADKHKELCNFEKESNHFPN